MNKKKKERNIEAIISLFITLLKVKLWENLINFETWHIFHKFLSLVCNNSFLNALHELEICRERD